MKSYISVFLLILFALCIAPVFAQEQQCSYIAPWGMSVGQNVFSSSIPACGLPDIAISNESYHSSPEISSIEQRKQQLKVLITDAYDSINKTSDKQEKADLKSAISAWRKEIFSLNYKMIIGYKNEYLEKITWK